MPRGDRPSLLDTDDDALTVVNKVEEDPDGTHRIQSLTHSTQLNSPRLPFPLLSSPHCIAVIVVIVAIVIVVVQMPSPSKSA